jgi:hypothetical protein
MADDEYECADDLLNRDVVVVAQGLEVRGKVIAVSGSVPGEWFAGVIQVLWSAHGHEAVHTIDLAHGIAVENCR